jgi:hypothetical protein
MKKLTVVVLAASALSMARAGECSPHEFDFSELGTVETVHQVPIPELLPNVFEHAVKPQTFDELLIRTDDGRTVILRDEGLQRFVAGERVRLVSSTEGPRVQHH